MLLACQLHARCPTCAPAKAEQQGKQGMTHALGFIGCSRQQDVKAGNVLLTDRGVGKLADVGTSRLQTHTFLSELPLIGTFAWVAPEVLMGGHNCTSAVDL